MKQGSNDNSHLFWYIAALIHSALIRVRYILYNIYYLFDLGTTTTTTTTTTAAAAAATKRPKWLHCVSCKSPFGNAWDLMVHVQTAHMMNIYQLADTAKLQTVSLAATTECSAGSRV
jgi:hypothetical protein